MRIAQRISLVSGEVLRVEEGSLYPALQKMLRKGWVLAEWELSETKRRMRSYRLTPAGRKHHEGRRWGSRLRAAQSRIEVFEATDTAFGQAAPAGGL